MTLSWFRDETIMKILLIYPYFLEERIHREEIVAVPIGLYSVAAVLRERQYDVEVLNWFEVDRAAESIPEILKKKRASGHWVFHREWKPLGCH